MKLVIASALLLALAAPVAQADDFNKAGTWSVGAGVHHVDPDAERGTSISGSTRASVSGEYFFRDNWGVALDMTAPSKHDFNIDGFGRFASAKAFMPTVSVKYHFDTQGNWKPFVGLGAAHVSFSDDEIDPAVAAPGTIDLDVRSRWAPVASVGVDYRIGQNSAIRADVRYVDVNPRVRANGADAGRVKFDPLVYGVQYVHQF